MPRTATGTQRQSTAESNKLSQRFAAGSERRRVIPCRTLIAKGARHEARKEACPASGALKQVPHLFRLIVPRCPVSRLAKRHFAMRPTILQEACVQPRKAGPVSQSAETPSAAFHAPPANVR